MKTKKYILSRWFCVMLVLLLTLTMAVPAFAAGNLTITIHNAKGLPAMTESQFQVYQLFTGTAHKDEEATVTPNNEWGATNWNNYTLADIEWGQSVKENERGNLLTALAGLQTESNAWLGEENPFAGLTASSTAADLAAVLAKHPDNSFMQGFASFLLKGNYLTDLELSGTVSKGVTAEQDALTYTIPSPGYYLFAETAAEHGNHDAVSEYILAVLGDQDINLKASVPDVEKDIVDSDNTDKGDAAGYGDTVTFQLTGTLPKNFFDFTDYDYIFTDTLSSGLTYIPGSLRVVVHFDKPVPTDVVLNKVDATDNETGYTLTEPEQDAKGGTLKVSFVNLMGVKYSVGSSEFSPWENKDSWTIDQDVSIVVTYDAKVNTDAVIGSTGNPNNVYLEYSNDPNSDQKGKTEEKIVYVYAFGLDLKKVGSDSKHQNGLPGAGFVLQNEAGQYAKFAKRGETNSLNLVSWEEKTVVETLINTYLNAKKEYDKASNEEQQNAEKNLQAARDALNEYLLVSGDDGEIPDVYGLDESSFTLTEVVTPAGYNTMDPFTFRIDAQINAFGQFTSVAYYAPANAGAPETTYTAGEDTKAVFESGLLPEQLENQKAPFLPFTGGTGTVIFYALGTALVAGAGLYLVIAAKKRKKHENNEA